MDEFFIWLSEFAPIVALGGCFCFAKSGDLPLTIAAGFLAVVLAIHHLGLEYISTRTIIQVAKGIDVRPLGDEDERRVS